MATKIKVWRDGTTKGLEKEVNGWLEKNPDVTVKEWLQNQSSVGDRVLKVMVTLTVVYEEE